MSKRKVASSLLPMLALMMVGLCSIAVNAQKGPQGTTGAPLKGVDVKLGRPPGGSPAARTTTDADGNFTFPVLPAGEYILTLELKKEVPDARTARSSGTPNSASDKTCTITLLLPDGQKVVKSFDLTQQKTFEPATDPAKQNTSRTKFETFMVRSDGTNQLKGTVIKGSRSNINNN